VILDLLKMKPPSKTNLSEAEAGAELMNRPTLRAYGIIFVVLGILMVFWGVSQLSELRMLDSRWYYETSRQLTGIGSGVVAMFMGWWIYRAA
jgi:hypothetical protein